MQTTKAKLKKKRKTYKNMVKLYAMARGVPFERMWRKYKDASKTKKVLYALEIVRFFERVEMGEETIDEKNIPKDFSPSSI